MTIGSLRNVLYAVARFLGDLNAVLRGRVLARLGRRLVGRFVAKWLGRLFR
jgi:hypothetical protein